MQACWQLTENCAMLVPDAGFVSIDLWNCKRPVAAAGLIRRECLDHFVVFGERHLRHVLLSYMDYYNGTRTHLSLNKDAPISRAAKAAGRILCRPILGWTASPICSGLICGRHSYL